MVYGHRRMRCVSCEEIVETNKNYKIKSTATYMIV